MPPDTKAIATAVSHTASPGDPSRNDPLLLQLAIAEMTPPAVTNRGVARLDGSAARFIKRANAPWPRKFAGNGVEMIRVFKAVDNSRGAARRIPNGVFVATAE